MSPFVRRFEASPLTMVLFHVDDTLGSSPFLWIYRDAAFVLGFSAWLCFVLGVGFVRAFFRIAWVFLVRVPLSSLHFLSM
jgi:hypothetical protein